MQSKFTIIKGSREELERQLVRALFDPEMKDYERLYKLLSPQNPPKRPNLRLVKK